MTTRDDGPPTADASPSDETLTVLSTPTPEPSPPEDDSAPRTDDDPRSTLERLLSPAQIALDATRRSRLIGWAGALGVTLLAAVLRLVDLGHPGTLVFDETYYVKEGYSLATLGYEANWPEGANDRFNAGDLDAWESAPEYVVHPPFAKWVIAMGFRLGNPADPATWRLSTAIAGIVAVFLLARIARRLFASNLLGTLAGGLLAIDGMAIVMSRTGLLDNILMVLVLAAFGALLLDREQARRRLAARVDLDPSTLAAWGPRLGMRWWRLASAVLLGLAIGSKWSGLYFLAAFGLLTVAWDLTARRSVGVRHWVRAGIWRDGAVAAAVMVPVAAATYLATWTGWLRDSRGWGRTWAADNPGEGVQWLPEALRSLWKYHGDMWAFHNSLTTEHSYQSQPLGWLLQLRPTSFHWGDIGPGDARCGSADCAETVLAVGNPVLWWAAAIALVACVVWFVRERDWRVPALLVGYVAGWLPWVLAYSHRTIFTFYAIVFTPWVVLTLTYALGRILGRDDAPERRRTLGIAAVVAIVTTIVLVSAFFYPVWTGMQIPRDQWQLRMWLPSWI